MSESDSDNAQEEPSESGSGIFPPLPTAYHATEKEFYPFGTDEEMTDNALEKYQFAKLTDPEAIIESLTGREQTLPQLLRSQENAWSILVQWQDEYIALEKQAKTLAIPNTVSIEKEQRKERSRAQGGSKKEVVRPAPKIVDPRAKTVIYNDKWTEAHQYQRNQDRIEASVYGYIAKEGSKYLGFQDPIGQRPPRPGQASRDLRQRNARSRGCALMDDDSDEDNDNESLNPPANSSRLQSLGPGLDLDGGRGKRQKKPSTRMTSGSRAASPPQPVNQKRPSRLAQWLEDDFNSEMEKNPDALLAHPRAKADKADMRAEQIKEAIRRGKKAEDFEEKDYSHLDQNDPKTQELIRNEKRRIGAHLGWVKRHQKADALAAQSAQGSINGDSLNENNDEGDLTSNKGTSEAGGGRKSGKKREPKMELQPDGTYREVVSAASINMYNRWAKKRSGEGGKIGREKKVDAATSSNAGDSEQATPAPTSDPTSSTKRKLDDADDQQPKKSGKGVYKRRKKNEMLSAETVEDDSATVNDESAGDAPQPNTNTSTTNTRQSSPGKRKAAQLSNDFVIDSDADDQPASTAPTTTKEPPKKRPKTGGRVKGTKNAKTLAKTGEAPKKGIKPPVLSKEYISDSGSDIEADASSLCEVCRKDTSPKVNRIVFCDDCDKGWHQRCHDPRVPPRFLKLDQWFCASCTVLKASKVKKKA